MNNTNVKVVIGANFGDEGKGLMTDYFCSNGKQGLTLNVRFNGGSQAGHTVWINHSEKHVFSHIGSGSFNNKTHTYLSEDFIVNPILFKIEMEKLNSLFIKPVVFVNKNVRITAPVDMMINQIVEKRRTNKHGSCGVGIFETVKRYENKKVREDLNYSINRLKELGVDNLTIEEIELLTNKEIELKFLQDMVFFIDNVTIVEDERELFKRYDNIIFEGAQGLLLDQNNLDFFPNLTPSNTGIKNVLKMLPFIKNPILEVCYVTRTYFTRHGAGKFPTECDIKDLKYDLVDETNKTNEFQGTLRFGYFDMKLFKSSVLKDSKLLESIPHMLSIAVTHCDITDGHLLLSSGNVSIETLENIEWVNAIYYSRSKVGKIFNKELF